MSRSPCFTESRNFSRISRISFRWISSFKEYAVASSISSSSLHNSDTWSVDRFVAFFLRKQSIAKFRVIFPRKDDRIVGLPGGMEFHVASQVSLTHSSESSLSYRTFQAMLKQYLPYFCAVACMASSDLSKYRLMIAVSSTFFTSYFFYLGFHKIRRIFLFEVAVLIKKFKFFLSLLSFGT